MILDCLYQVRTQKEVVSCGSGRATSPENSYVAPWSWSLQPPEPWALIPVAYVTQTERTKTQSLAACTAEARHVVKRDGLSLNYIVLPESITWGRNQENSVCNPVGNGAFLIIWKMTDQHLEFVFNLLGSGHRCRICPTKGKGWCWQLMLSHHFLIWHILVWFYV